MNKKYIPTVTIAACAHNEEHNMAAFVRSILRQKAKGFKIVKIFIISDGSTDKTVKIARSFTTKKIQVIEHKKRTGKSSHLNHIYRMLDTDILVQSDTDVIFSHPHVIANLIRPLLTDIEVGMTGGNPTPLKAETRIEKAINHSVEVYKEFRKTVRGGNNVFSADGRLLAYKKELVKKIRIPYDMIANDMYTYFCCLSYGYAYQFAPKAKVQYRSPQTLIDHIKQNTRFRAGPMRMKRYFSAEVVDREMSIPLSIYVFFVAKQFIKSPLLSVHIYLVNIVTKLIASISERKLTAKWYIARTTKELKSI